MNIRSLDQLARGIFGTHCTGVSRDVEGRYQINLSPDAPGDMVLAATEIANWVEQLLVTSTTTNLIADGQSSVLISCNDTVGQSQFRYWVWHDGNAYDSGVVAVENGKVELVLATEQGGIYEIDMAWDTMPYPCSSVRVVAVED
jgi:hypothetical protein